MRQFGSSHGLVLPLHPKEAVAGMQCRRSNAPCASTVGTELELQGGLIPALPSPSRAPRYVTADWCGSYGPRCVAETTDVVEVLYDLPMLQLRRVLTMCYPFGSCASRASCCGPGAGRGVDCRSCCHCSENRGVTTRATQRGNSSSTRWHLVSFFSPIHDMDILLSSPMMWGLG